MSDSKKNYSEDRFRKTFGLTDSNIDTEAISSFRLSRAYLLKFNKTFGEIFKSKKDASKKLGAQAEALQKIEEENSNFESSVADFEKRIRLIKTQIDQKKAAKANPQPQTSPFSSTRQTANPWQPPPQPTYTAPSYTPPPVYAAPKKSNTWKWVAGFLGVVFVVNVLSDKDDKPATGNTPAKPAPIVKAEPPALRPNVEADFISWFYITKRGTPLYDMNARKTRFTIPTDGCVNRYTLFNSNTILQGQLHVLATSAAGGTWSGYVRISDLKVAPDSMTEVKCFYDQPPQEEPVTFNGIGTTLEQAGPSLKVTNLVQGAPAQRAGVEIGDIILRIDGYPTEGMNLDNALGKLKGKAGEPVTILVKKQNQSEPVRVALIREQITIYPSGQAKVTPNKPVQPEVKPEVKPATPEKKVEPPTAAPVDPNTKTVGIVGIQWEIAGAYIRVTDVTADLPAQKAGIQTGDIIVLINDKSLVNQMTAEQVLEEIRGVPDTNVSLLVKRANVADPIRFTMTRQAAAVPNAASNDSTGSVEAAHFVPTPKGSGMNQAMESFGDQMLRSDIDTNGARKFSASVMPSLDFPIFARDHAPSGLDARNLRRLYNYGYCGTTTDYLPSESDQNIAKALNACTQNYRVHMTVTSTNQIDKSVLDFMYRQSKPQDYILFALRDGVAEKGDIIKIQAALNHSGIDVGKEDGAWGRKTTNGLIRFMKSRPNDFFDVSQAYLDIMRNHMNADNKSILYELGLSRARNFNPGLKRQDFAFAP